MRLETIAGSGGEHFVIGRSIKEVARTLNYGAPFRL